MVTAHRSHSPWCANGSIVPDGSDPRDARIPPHAKTVARKAIGLEATLVDYDVTMIGALDPADPRRFALAVAGPSALLVSKVHKMLDRAESAAT